MRELKKRRIVLPAVAVAAAVALTAAPAASAAKVISKSRTVTISGTTLGSVTAKCPRGLSTVGGGYTSSPQTVATPASLLVVFESQRAGTRGWRVSAGQAVNGTGELTAFVYCTQLQDQLRQVKSTLPIGSAPRSEANDVTAICPKGSKVISGGFKVPPTQNGATVFLTSSVKSGGRNWVIDAVRDNDTATAGSAVQSFGYCGKALAAKVKSKTTTVTTNLSADVVPVAQTPPCANPANVASGGFTAPYVQNGNDRGAIIVTESRRAKGGWITSGYGSGPSGFPVSLTSFAYCR